MAIVVTGNQQEEKIKTASEQSPHFVFYVSM